VELASLELGTDCCSFFAACRPEAVSFITGQELASFAALERGELKDAVIWVICTPWPVVGAYNGWNGCSKLESEEGLNWARLASGLGDGASS